MVAIAQERSREAGAPESVHFVLGDILEMPLAGPFDVIWSRDALMHLPDKPRLFARLHELLAPGGRLVITDYARGAGEVSPEFRAYAEKTGYHLTDPASYGQLLEGAGFRDVVVEDATDRFVDDPRAGVRAARGPTATTSSPRSARRTWTTCSIAGR